MEPEKKKRYEKEKRKRPIYAKKKEGPYLYTTPSLYKFRTTCLSHPDQSFLYSCSKKKNERKEKYRELRRKRRRERKKGQKEPRNVLFCLPQSLTRTNQRISRHLDSVRGSLPVFSCNSLARKREHAGFEPVVCVGRENDVFELSAVGELVVERVLVSGSDVKKREEGHVKIVERKEKKENLPHAPPYHSYPA